MVPRGISLFILFILTFTLCACGLPTLAAPSSTASAGTILYKDDFSSPASGWNRIKYAEGIMDYDGGGYRMLVNALQANFWSTPRKDFADVRIEVDAGKLAGPDENRIGLICRFDGKSYYFFIISSDGYYGLGIFKNGQTALLGLSEMQSSDKIKTGVAVNHLQADCNRDELGFYVNGFQLADIHDPSLQHGDVGLLAGTFGKPGVDIVFDNFVVLKP
jgi:hypothetical protein